MDNQSAIALSKNPVLHDCSKHIDTQFHFIRDCVDSGRLYMRGLCEHSGAARRRSDEVIGAREVL
jgi:hypothetical protein